MDFMKMMKQAKDLQTKMAAMQEEIAAIEVEGVAGAGLVSVTLNGKGEMRRLSIEPALFKEDGVEILEDLIIAAHNDAKAKAEAAMQDKMKDLTGGLQLPPGLQLPI